MWKQAENLWKITSFSTDERMERISFVHQKKTILSIMKTAWQKLYGIGQQKERDLNETERKKIGWIQLGKFPDAKIISYIYIVYQSF